MDKDKIYVQAVNGCEPVKNGDWIDLFTEEDVELKQFDFKLIPLGVAMKLPEGYEANIVPRSSTYMKHGVIQANHFGVIDNAYCGKDDKWYFPAIALRDTFIPKHTRICQFKIVKNMDSNIWENRIYIDSLEDKNRGGFGSTG